MSFRRRHLRRRSILDGRSSAARRFIAHVEGVPKSPSPICHAAVVGNTCHISGQLAVYGDGYRAGAARDEAARPFDLTFLIAEAAGLIAEAAGFSRADIVYVDIAFSDLDDLPAVNELYAVLFDNPPARTV